MINLSSILSQIKAPSVGTLLFAKNPKAGESQCKYALERVEEVLRSDSIRKDELLLSAVDEDGSRDDLDYGKDHVQVHRVLDAD